jgi:hypothetical protein
VCSLPKAGQSQAVSQQRLTVAIVPLFDVTLHDITLQTSQTPLLANPVCKKAGKTTCGHSKRWSEVSTTQRYTQGWLAWEWRGKAITAVAPKTYEKVEWSEDLTRRGNGAVCATMPI